MTTEQSRSFDENRKSFEEGVTLLSTWTPRQAFEQDEHGNYVVAEIRNMWRGYKLGRTQLLAEIKSVLESPECVELMENAMDSADRKARCGSFGKNDASNYTKAKASISTIVKKMKGEK